MEVTNDNGSSEIKKEVEDVSTGSIENKTVKTEPKEEMEQPGNNAEPTELQKKIIRQIEVFSY
jgi:hypothetical protein